MSKQIEDSLVRKNALLLGVFALHATDEFLRYFILDVELYFQHLNWSRLDIAVRKTHTRTVVGYNG